MKLAGASAQLANGRGVQKWLLNWCLIATSLLAFASLHLFSGKEKKCKVAALKQQSCHISRVGKDTKVQWLPDFGRIVRNLRNWKARWGKNSHHWEITIFWKGSWSGSKLLTRQRSSMTDRVKGTERHCTDSRLVQFMHMEGTIFLKSCPWFPTHWKKQPNSSPPGLHHLITILPESSGHNKNYRKKGWHHPIPPPTCYCLVNFCHVIEWKVNNSVSILKLQFLYWFFFKKCLFFKWWIFDLFNKIKRHSGFFPWKMEIIGKALWVLKR